MPGLLPIERLVPSHATGQDYAYPALALVLNAPAVNSKSSSIGLLLRPLHSEVCIAHKTLADVVKAVVDMWVCMIEEHFGYVGVVGRVLCELQNGVEVDADVTETMKLVENSDVV